jgi:heavy metal translocating P-type ATPase
MGCANVYSILLESGVLASGQNIRETEVFRRSLELGLISNPQERIEPATASAQSLDVNAPTAEAVYQIGGMWCSACGWLIEHALRRLPGVKSAEVFFASDLAKVTYHPQYLPPDRIAARIAAIGYCATEHGQENDQAQKETRDLVMRLGVAAFLWANIMAFSTILYVGYFEQIAASASRTLPIILLVLATPLVFFCAFPILRTAAIGLRHLQVRMETLLALGILTAYFFSAVQTLRGQTHVYFDTAAAIVTLVLAGKLIERRAKDRAARSISNLYRMMPRKVRLESAAGERFISIDALEPGAIFICKTGERIPADGIVTDGETEADESLLTGESAPVRKRPGDQVISGSLNVGNLIKVRALRRSDSSALAQIVRLVERALSSRAPIERTVDHVSRVFVPAVVVFAVLAFAILAMMHAGLGAALMRAITILVIACPCALGLATPLAITAAVGNASSKGLLIADTRVLETMSTIDTLILDKTGTITHGDFRLVSYELFAQGNDPSDTFLREYMPLLAGMEACSEHLLGRAVVRYAREHRVQPVEISSVLIRKGQGITANRDSRILFIGNHALVRDIGGELPEAAAACASQWQKSGHTVSFFGIDEQVRGVLVFGDQIKPGAMEMVKRFKERGVPIRLVSGDSRLSTEFIARQVGIDAFTAEAFPEDKVRIVQELQQEARRVAVIGDGVNDAPALAQADLGIALGTGADIAMSVAPVVLMSGALSNIDDAFCLASATRQVIRQNLFWAFFYNIAGISLALTGVLSPISAAGGMLLSSSCVVANSMRLTGKKAESIVGMPDCVRRVL